MYRYNEHQLSGFQDSPSSNSAMNRKMAGYELATPIYAFIQMAKTATLAVVVYVSSSHIHIGWGSG